MKGHFLTASLAAAVLVCASFAAQAQTMAPMAPMAPADTSPAPAAADTAPSPAASTKAERKAERIANHRLERAVLHALSRTKGLNSDHIVVLSRNGATTLAGTVPDGQQIELATAAAKSVKGVTSVKNALSVRPIGG